MPKAVIFDLDGTLWPATEVALPAFRRVLHELNLPEVSDEALAHTLGYPLQEIWDMLIPREHRHLAPLADKLMEQAEHDLLLAGMGRTFPRVRETISQIRQQGFLTFICSNCQSAYLEFTPKALGIVDLFTQKYCAGMYNGLSKAAIVGIIKQEHSITTGFMVGDRFHDVEAGQQNGLVTVGCSFGTGKADELVAADYTIAKFDELTKVIASAQTNCLQP